MKKANIAVIVEGENREPAIVRNMQSFFFKGEQIKIITLPAAQNIYMLWKILKEDDFETDIIEILRESSEKSAEELRDFSRDDFSEIYLFFDYDGHQMNLPAEENGETVLDEMLRSFDNETENGKLYLSYPMVEALRDIGERGCAGVTGCEISLTECEEYKRSSAENIRTSQISHYQFSDWETALDFFAMRVSCLFEREEVFTYQDYKRIVSPLEIYRKQRERLRDDRIFVLSAFPEFLLDYQKGSFWRSKVKKKHNYRSFCQQREGNKYTEG